MPVTFTCCNCNKIAEHTEVDPDDGLACLPGGGWTDVGDDYVCSQNCAVEATLDLYDLNDETPCPYSGHPAPAHRESAPFGEGQWVFNCPCSKERASYWPADTQETAFFPLHAQKREELPADAPAEPDWKNLREGEW